MCTLTLAYRTQFVWFEFIYYKIVEFLIFLQARWISVFVLCSNKYFYILQCFCGFCTRTSKINLYLTTVGIYTSPSSIPKSKSRGMWMGVEGGKILTVFTRSRYLHWFNFVSYYDKRYFVKPHYNIHYFDIDHWLWVSYNMIEVVS